MLSVVLQLCTRNELTQNKILRYRVSVHKTEDTVLTRRNRWRSAEAVTLHPCKSGRPLITVKIVPLGLEPFFHKGLQKVTRRAAFRRNLGQRRNLFPKCVYCCASKTTNVDSGNIPILDRGRIPLIHALVSSPVIRL